VFIAKQNPQATLFVTPADQIILKEEQYRQDVLHGMEFASENDGLLVMGITPSRPETGYGYIQMNDDRPLSHDIYPVKSFTEKPDAEFANIFMQEENFLWNTGLLCFNTRVMLDNLFMLIPEYRLEIPRLMAEAESNDPKLVPENFNVLPNRNMDVSILERSEHVYVQRGHFGWADIGTWASIGKDLPANDEGNILLNTDAHLYECSGNIVRLPEGRTAVIKGLKDYVVAEEGEILMICPRQDVAAMRRMHTDTKFGDSKN
ncbi:MAG: mannose-1-phosphate guanylyltransferase, partial [Bacteroidaceae bacterium]|nr:mannose-1-phosphate guanylyltransferase [Bacteroidaceae bacterium]